MERKPEGARLRVTGYVRMSAEEQARQGFSLGKRQAKIRPYGDFNDPQLVEIFLPLFRGCFPPGLFAFSIKSPRRSERLRFFPLFPTWVSDPL